MKKTTALVVLAAALAGCGGGSSGGDAEVLPDPATPTISIGDVSATESSPSLAFPVTLSAASAAAVRVNFATANGTAAADQDYRPASGTISLPAGATRAEISVELIDDTTDEPDETFSVSLADPVGAALADGRATGTLIDDDDDIALPSISIEDASATEAGPAIGFVLTLSAASAHVVRVDFTTADGTATAGQDYRAASGTLSIPAGATQAAVSVELIDDAAEESVETFTVSLVNPAGASIADASATGTLIDDETLLAESTFDPDWGRVGVFNDAATCAQCHRASSDNDPATPAVMREPLNDAGRDVSQSRQWGHSVMAHAFGEPYFLAKLVDEITLLEGIAGTIEDKCLTCHAPMARTHAHQTGTPLQTGADCALAEGCYRLDQAIDAMHAKAGINCTTCHQIKADGLGEPESFSGNYQIASELEDDAFTAYGPYPGPHPGGANAMLANSGYLPVHGPHVTQSGFCGTCHTLHTQTIDILTGEATGRKFLEQAAFPEWQNSAFVTGGPEATECQGCHQPIPGGSAGTSRIAVRPDGNVNPMWPERTPFYEHELVGGNTHILQMLSTYNDLLGLQSSTTAQGFAEKIAQTRAFLSNATAALDIAPLALVDGTLNIDVTVFNKTGHKLPTSYPSRRVWLHLVVRDGAGNTVFESGAPDARGRVSTDSSSLAAACLTVLKPEGFDNGTCYEPHRDVITLPTQVATWESVMADTNGHITHVLLLADSYLKDNRLPPRGFTVARANAIEPQTVPVGVDGDADFNRDGTREGTGTDRVHYRIDTAGRTGPFRVDARLLLQSIRPSFVASMHSDMPRVLRFKAMYEAVPPVVEELAHAAAAL